MSADLDRRRVAGAAPHPCAACPWRMENQAGADPHGLYRPANLARLWRGLRRGECMTCHPTDDTVPAHGAPPGARTTECAGSLILLGREAMRFQALIREEDTGNAAFRRYRGRHPFGMTMAGLRRLVERAFVDGPLTGRRVDQVDLNDGEIGYSPLADWEGTP